MGLYTTLLKYSMEDIMDDSVELTKEILDSGEDQIVAAALMAIGSMAVKSLLETGTANFIMGEDDVVRYVNPLHVYYGQGALEQTDDMEVKYLRPIVTEGKPKYVAFKGNRLWEIELIEKDKE